MYIIFRASRLPGHWTMDIHVLAIFLLTTLSMLCVAVGVTLSILPEGVVVLLPLSLAMFITGILQPAISFVKQLLEERSQEETFQKESEFSIKSAITSIWLPCVVGQRPYTFILSAVTSLAFKNLLFILAVLLNHLQVIEINVFLLWCVDAAKTKIYEARNITVCHSLQTCFENTTNTFEEQRIRVCHESPDENLVFLAINVLTGLCVLSMLSAIASFKLDKIIDHERFYQSTKTLFCFKTRPVVHRSLLFILASSDKHQELLEEVTQDIKEYMTEDVTEFRVEYLTNRPRMGETPLYYSTKLGAVRCTDILLRKGARLTENGEDPPVVPTVIE